jgi:small subunit ribosomal protein S6
MTTVKVNVYEMLLIFKSGAESDNMDQLVKTVEQLLRQYRGKVLRSDKIGRKKLAYQIGKNKEALMAVLAFELDPSQITTLVRALKLNEDVLRATILRNDDLDPSRPFVLTPVTGKEPKEAGRGGPRGGGGGGRDSRGPRRNNVMRSDEAPREGGGYQRQERSDRPQYEGGGGQQQAPAAAQEA